MNKTTKVLSFAIAMFALVGLVTFPISAAADYGYYKYEGCTPGFYKANDKKNDADQWPVGFNPGDTLASHGVVNENGVDVKSTTLIEALKFKGGNGLEGKEQIFLRAATAAILNANQEDSTLYYIIHNPANLIENINNTLASDDLGKITHDAGLLDHLNNGPDYIEYEFCPLSNSGKY